MNKYCRNIVQILCNYNYVLFIYCTVAVQVSTKYWANTVQKKLQILQITANIAQILWKYCSIIVKIYYKYYPNIVQILFNKVWKLYKENRPSCCRWGKIYRNHCLIGYICGWNIMQTWIVVSTANPVTEICNGQAYARCYLCLHLFPATNILN